MPRVPGARRPRAVVLSLVLSCASSAALPIDASAAAPADASVASPPHAAPALRSARLERTALLHDDRFVLRASAVPKTSAGAQHRGDGLALRAAHLSTTAAAGCATGDIFKDGFEQP